MQITVVIQLQIPILCCYHVAILFPSFMKVKNNLIKVHSWYPRGSLVGATRTELHHCLGGLLCLL